MYIVIQSELIVTWYVKICKQILFKPHLYFVFYRSIFTAAAKNKTVINPTIAHGKHFKSYSALLNF